MSVVYCPNHMTGRWVNGASVHGRDMFDRYVKLLEKIDERLAGLAPCDCPPQCDRCCRLSFSLFPVEAFFLREAFVRLSPVVGHRLQEQAVSLAGRICPFLLDHGCTVYDSRPVLCRTHGYPFLRRLSDGDTAEIHPGCEVLSFASRPQSGKGTLRISALDLDGINTHLVSVNHLFLQAAGSLTERLPDRIPMTAIPSDPFPGMIRGECHADL